MANAERPRRMDDGLKKDILGFLALAAGVAIFGSSAAIQTNPGAGAVSMGIAAATEVAAIGGYIKVRRRMRRVERQRNQAV